MAELRPLQQQALEPLRDRWVHGDPPGAGKTPVGLRWLEAHRARRVLIVAPSNVVGHWANLASEWYPGLQAVPVHKGTSKTDRASARQGFSTAAGLAPAAYVTSYALWREDQDALVEGGWDAVIFDEAHRLKGRTTLLHKGAEKLARRVPLMDLSTGSPIMNDAEEAWSYLHLMDPKGYRSFWKWAGEHFEIEQTTFYGRLPRAITRIVAPKEGALEAIAAEFGPRLVQRPEHIILPHIEEAYRIVYEVPLSPEERRAYDGLAKHGWTRGENDEVLVASNALAKRTRLRQMASDWSSALGDMGKASSKVTALAELVGDLDHKSLLVFVSFKTTADAVVTRLAQDGVVAATFTGDDDQDARDAALRDFVSGRAQVLVGTYGALAEGTDGLQFVSHHVALLDHGDVPEIERQAIRRLQRDGQTLQVIVHDFIAKDTVEEEIVNELHVEKVATANTVLGRGAA